LLHGDTYWQRSVKAGGVILWNTRQSQIFFFNSLNMSCWCWLISVQSIHQGSCTKL